MKHEIDDDGNIKLKTILIGDSGVGKTNLINIAAGKDFNINERSTVNASFFRKQLEVDGKIYNLYLWDTIGQEKLKSITKIFFKNSKIVVLVYDITNKQSFQGLDYWLKEVREVLGENIIIGICGNKADLYLNEEVSEDDCKEYANKLKARWICTSAKTDKTGFPNFLKELIKEYMNFKPNKKEEDKKEIIEDKNDKKIVLKDNEYKGKKKKKKFCSFFS